LPRPHMGRGQDGSLLLSCVTLSFTTSRRFIPTLSRDKPCPYNLLDDVARRDDVVISIDAGWKRAAGWTAYGTIPYTISYS
jgi:hypothetical protein